MACAVHAKLCTIQPQGHTQMGILFVYAPFGLFALSDLDSVSDSDLHYKPYGYIVLCRTCFHDSDSDSFPKRVPILGIDLCPRDRSPSRLHRSTFQSRDQSLNLTQYA